MPTPHPVPVENATPDGTSSTDGPPLTPQPATAPPTAGPTDAAAPASRTADFTAGPGGVMTDEVGVVTGDLTLRTEAADGQVSVQVQYKDAAEWYAVTGGRAPLHDPADAEAVHQIVLGILNRPEG